MAQSEAKTGFSFIKTYPSVCLALAIGILVSFAMFWVEHQQLQHEIHTEFRQLTEDRAFALQRTLEKKELVLHALRSLYLGSEKVERHEFQTAVSDLLGSASSFQALEWIPRVPGFAREQYEAEAKQSGLTGFQFTERNNRGEWGPATQRPEYFPVYYLEPFEGNEFFLGRDLASDPKLLRAIQTARQTGEIKYSERLKLGPEDDAFGFQMFLPLVCKDPVSGKEDLEGLVSGVFYFNELIDKALSALSPRGVDTFLYDLSASQGDQLLYVHPSRFRKEHYQLKPEDQYPPAQGFFWTQPLEIGGRRWLVVCKPSPAFPEFDQLFYPYLLLGMGLLLTWVLAFYFLHLKRSQWRLHDQIERRRIAEEENKKNKEWFENLITEAPLAILGVDRHGILNFSKGKRLDALGSVSGDVIGRSVHDLFPKDSKILSGIMLALSGVNNDAIIEIGGLIFHYQFSPLFYHNDEISGVICVANDITQLRRSQIELEKNRTQLLMAQKLSGLGIWEYDPATRRTVWSEEMFRIHGLDPKDGVPPFDRLTWMVHPEDRGRWGSMIEEITQTGTSKRFEFRIVRPDGEWRWILSHEAAQCQIDGKPLYFYGTLLDITELRQVEKALREREAILQAIASSAQDAVIMIDSEGRISFWNDAAERILGWTKDEAKGQILHFFIAPERYREGYRRAFPHFQTTGEGAAVGRTIELTALRKDKSEIPVELSLSAVPIGNKWNAIGILRDITERKQLQNELLHAQKMESVGRLAGGIAHDFNNLITVISGYVEYLLNSTDKQSIEYSVAKDIKAAADRAADLTKRLLGFSRRQMIQPRVLNLNELILSLEPMLRRLIPENIEYAIIPADDLGAVEVDAGQIEQVLTNLVVNAADAMPEGGKLFIKTQNMSIDQNYIDRGGPVPGGDYVLVSVSDTGTGMSDAVKAHLFEPFFTTKEKGRGTGLGLATVYGIVQQNKGHITVYSEVGQGTVIKIYFSRIIQPQASDVAKQPSGPKPGRGKETVLFVEDEKLVRELAVRILHEFGYRVLSAANGQDALRVLEEYGGSKVDLLATDVVMPQMGGKELSDHVRQKYPQMKVLYLSGYADDVLIHQDIIKHDVAFLQKPFSRATLTAKVREVLDRDE